MRLPSSLNRRTYENFHPYQRDSANIHPVHAPIPNIFAPSTTGLHSPVLREPWQKHWLEMNKYRQSTMLEYECPPPQLQAELSHLRRVGAIPYTGVQQSETIDPTEILFPARPHEKKEEPSVQEQYRRVSIMSLCTTETDDSDKTNMADWSSLGDYYEDDDDSEDDSEDNHEKQGSERNEMEVERKENVKEKRDSEKNKISVQGKEIVVGAADLKLAYFNNVLKLKCPYCETKYARSDSLRRHMMKSERNGVCNSAAGRPISEEGQKRIVKKNKKKQDKRKGRK